MNHFEDYLRAMTYFKFTYNAFLLIKDFGGHCPGEMKEASVVGCWVQIKYDRSFGILRNNP